MNDLTPTSHALNLKFFELCKGRETVVDFLCVLFFMEIQEDNLKKIFRYWHCWHILTR